jgi:hypothetical protein
MALNSVLSTTLQLLRDKLIDNSFLAHPLIRAIEENGNLVKVSGGSRVEQPVIFGDHSSITELTNGFEAVNMAVRDPFTSAKFEYANFTQPIVLSAVEKAANKGDLAGREHPRLEDEERHVVAQAAGEPSDHPGFEHENHAAPDAQRQWHRDLRGEHHRMARGVGPATQGNSIGTLSKVTYRAQNWFNQIQDAAGALTLADLDQLFIQSQIYSPDGNLPDILLMSPACYSAFLNLMDQRIQYITVADRAGLAKEMVATYRGARVYVDPFLGFTANGASGMGAKPVSAYLLNSKQFQLYADVDGWFNVGEMLPVPGTATEAAMVFCRMQLTTGHLASHSILIDAEA